MRKDWKYIIYVAGAVLLFVTVKLLSPKQFDWSVTLAHDDKDPYGTFALNELLPNMFSKQEIRNCYQTIYELKDSLKADENILIISRDFLCEEEDANALLDHVAQGGTVFISSQYFRGHLADTLNINSYDYFFSDGGGSVYNSDSSALRFSNNRLDTTRNFWFKRDNIHNSFQRFDTTRTTIIAKNDNNDPVTIRIQWGKGNIILNTTPLAFTNIYLLSKNNHEFVSNTFSYLPIKKIYWTEYYHVGRMEAKTPLRFVLNTEPLAWAYYLIISSILLLMVFEAKRKQRIIPVVKPPANTSLEFVSTIGNLFYQTGDHKNIAEKKINFFLEQIRTKFLLKTNRLDEQFFDALASKSGNSKEDVIALFSAISYTQSSSMISVGQLMDLNDKIEKFNKNK